MQTVRHAIDSDLPDLLALYRHLNPDTPVPSPKMSERIWRETLARPGLTVFVTPHDGMLVASCMLITAPNLMRGGAPHAFIESVVVHQDYRDRGLGRAILDAAAGAAWAAGCFQIMLLTRHTNTDAHTFYQSCGFTADRKAGFVMVRPGAE